AAHDEYAPAEAGPVVVKGGVSPVPMEIVMHQGATIEGKVADREGLPIAGAQAEVRTSGRRTSVVLVEPDGSYRVKRVTGEVTVRASAPAFAPAEANLSIGADQDGRTIARDFTLEPAG